MGDARKSNNVPDAALRAHLHSAALQRKTIPVDHRFHAIKNHSLPVLVNKNLEAQQRNTAAAVLSEHNLQHNNNSETQTAEGKTEETFVEFLERWTAPLEVDEDIAVPICSCRELCELRYYFGHETNQDGEKEPRHYEMWVCKHRQCDCWNAYRISDHSGTLLFEDCFPKQRRAFTQILEQDTLPCEMPDHVNAPSCDCGCACVLRVNRTPCSSNSADGKADWAASKLFVCATNTCLFWTYAQNAESKRRSSCPLPMTDFERSQTIQNALGSELTPQKFDEFSHNVPIENTDVLSLEEYWAEIIEHSMFLDSEMSNLLASLCNTAPGNCDCGDLMILASCKYTGELYFMCCTRKCRLVTWAGHCPALHMFDAGQVFLLGNWSHDRWTSLTFVMRWCGRSFSRKFIEWLTGRDSDAPFPRGSYEFPKIEDEDNNTKSKLVQNVSGSGKDASEQEESEGSTTGNDNTSDQSGSSGSIEFRTNSNAFDIFLSYRGATPCALQYLALAGRFNMTSAIVCFLLIFPLLVAVLFAVFPDPCVTNVPDFFLWPEVCEDGDYFGFGWFLFVPWGSLLLILLILFYNPLFSWATSSYKIFMDKYCIHQSDRQACVEGIARLPLFLRCSKKLICMFDAVYASRMWCVFELAVYLKIRTNPVVEFVSVSKKSLEVIAVCFIIFQTSVLFSLDHNFGDWTNAFAVDSLVDGVVDSAIDDFLSETRQSTFDARRSNYNPNWSGSIMEAWYDRGSWATHSSDFVVWFGWCGGVILVSIVFLLGQRHFIDQEALRDRIENFSIADADLANESNRADLLRFVQELFGTDKNFACGLEAFNAFVRTNVPKLLPVSGLKSWALFSYKTSLLAGASYVLGSYDVFAYNAESVESPFLGFAHERKRDQEFGTPVQFYFSDAWQSVRTVFGFSIVVFILIPLQWYFMSVEIKFFYEVQKRTKLDYWKSVMLFLPVFLVWECVLSWPTMFFDNIERLVNFAVVSRSLPCYRWQQYYDCTPMRYSQPLALHFQPLFGIGFVLDTTSSLFDFPMQLWISALVFLFVIIPAFVLVFAIYEPSFSIRFRAQLYAHFCSKTNSSETSKKVDEKAQVENRSEHNQPSKKTFYQAITTNFKHKCDIAIAAVLLFGPFLYIIIFAALDRDGFQCEVQQNASFDNLFVRCVATAQGQPALVDAIHLGIQESGLHPASNRSLSDFDLSLDLRSNRLESLPADIQELDSLVYLDARNNRLKSLEALQNLENLKGLRLYENHLENIETVATLKSLEYLDLGKNFVSNAKPIENCTNLQILNLANNHLPDAAMPIFKAPDGDRFPRLQSLFIDNNAIEGEFLKNNLRAICGLKDFDACGNPFSLDFKTHGVEDHYFYVSDDDYKYNLQKGPAMPQLLKQLSADFHCENMGFQCWLEEAIVGGYTPQRFRCVQNVPGDSLGSAILDAVEHSNNSTNVSGIDLDYNFLTALPDDLQLFKDSLSFLSASANELVDVSALSDMDNIKILQLTDNRIPDFEGVIAIQQVELLWLNNNLLTNINQLPRVPNVVDLKLDFNQLESVFGLTKTNNMFQKLESLSLNYNRLSSLVGLPPTLPALRILFLENNLLTDFTGIPRLPSVTLFSIKFNQINDLSALGNAPELRSLYLNGNKIRTVESFQQISLPSLTSLMLADNELSRLTAADLKAFDVGGKLEILVLTNNFIYSIEKMPEFPSLETLALHDNPLRTLDFLRDFHSSRFYQLNVSNTTVLDFQDLPATPNLKFLWANNNGISGNLKELQRFPKMEWLELSCNKLQSLDGLPVFENIRTMDFDNNSLQNIDALAKYKDLGRELTRLNLEKNKLGDISVLKNFQQLETLLLSQNKISDASSVSQLAQLRSLDLSSNHLETVPSLINAHELLTLLLFDNNIKTGDFLEQNLPLFCGFQGVSADKKNTIEFADFCNNPLTSIEATCQAVGIKNPGSGRTDPMTKYPDVQHSFLGMLNAWGLYCPRQR